MNRSEQKARVLAERIAARFGIAAEHLPLRSDLLQQELGDADVVVNATSVGMRPNIKETVVTPRLLKRDAVLMDIVYNPLETRLLREAKQRGLKTVDGLHMLVNQAAKAFEIWTGRKAPLDLMRIKAIEALEAR